MINIFKNHKVRRNFIITLFIIVLINVISLVTWYYLRIKPSLNNIENTKETIINEKIAPSYSSYEELEKNIDSLSQEYDVILNIVDEENNTLKDNKPQETNLEIFSTFTKVDNHLYIINGYFSKEINPVNIILSLISFQIIIVAILMISAYIFTGHLIITPIEKIINDLRNYKFGKKPARNEVNNELDVIQNEFVNLVDSLEAEKKEQKRIIASISHDIKTPLTSIIGYSSLMEDNLSKKEIKEYSTKVHEKALHIKDILATFDDYLVNYDKQKITLSVVSIKDLINELNEDYKIELNNKNIEFNITTDCENAKLNIDILKIKRVFSNIISNSAKFVPKKGLINITILKKNNYIEFTIADNGPGVDEKIIDKLFDPFFTTDPSRKISGLGLSICKEFIEVHKGTIKAYNDHGLTIKFKLPVYNEKDKK